MVRKTANVTVYIAGILGFPVSIAFSVLCWVNGGFKYASTAKVTIDVAIEMPNLVCKKSRMFHLLYSHAGISLMFSPVMTSGTAMLGIVISG